MSGVRLTTFQRKNWKSYSVMPSDDGHQLNEVLLNLS